MSLSSLTKKSVNSHAGMVPARVLETHHSRKLETLVGRALFLGVVAFSASQAGANPINPPISNPIITYTFTGVGSGTLNGHSFVNATFMITAEAYVSQITSPVANVFSVSDFSSSISIAGLGVANFTDQMISVLNQNNNVSTLPAIGFSDVTKGVAVIFETNPTFDTYNLGYASSVVNANSVQLSPNNTFATSQGNLSLTAVMDASYYANLAVPDSASTLGLFSLSAASLFFVRRKYSFSQAA